MQPSIPWGVLTCADVALRVAQNYIPSCIMEHEQVYVQLPSAFLVPLKALWHCCASKRACNCVTATLCIPLHSNSNWARATLCIPFACTGVGISSWRELVVGLHCCSFVLCTMYVTVPGWLLVLF